MTSPAGLTIAFFARPAHVVAPDLIGRTLSVRHGGTVKSGVIVETEAYGGVDDPASHAAFRPGGRAAIMSQTPGLVYVYAAYGMYPCLNIVTNREGEPGAVLIRGIKPEDGSTVVNGPGRSARWLGVTLDDQGELIIGERFFVSETRLELPVEVTPRIGISRAIDTEWRFVARID